MEELGNRWGIKKGSPSKDGGRRVIRIGSLTPRRIPEPALTERMTQPSLRAGDLDQPVKTGRDHPDLDQPVSKGDDQSEGLDQSGNPDDDRPRR